ncbi:MAG: hypothetical protein QM772_15225 [Ottowia sp.]|uniref:hypothetical protein n=1 Tax=Ottowia sp. TaxID=1898956 RepID=UPI0039E71B0F
MKISSIFLLVQLILTGATFAQNISGEYLLCTPSIYSSDIPGETIENIDCTKAKANNRCESRTLEKNSMKTNANFYVLGNVISNDQGPVILEEHKIRRNDGHWQFTIKFISGGILKTEGYCELKQDKYKF